MKEITITTQFKVFDSFENLPNDIQELMEQAIVVRKNAYAPYSKFRVGVAILLDNGKIVLGSNQENAAYPSGLCAERSAIFAAQSQRPDQAIDALAIAAYNNNGFLADPITPCGACRQVILEMEDRYKQNVRILLYGTKGVYVLNSVKDLLPFSFVDENMKK